MVLCLIVGCSKRSGRDKDVSFYRVPKVIHNKGPYIKDLTLQRRAGFIAAISRDDLTESILENDRVCSRHFISGVPADLHDRLNPDWLPTQSLGHSKVDSSQAVASIERYQRAVERNTQQENQQKLEAAQALLLLSVSNEKQEMESVIQSAVQTDLTSESFLLFEQEISELHDKLKILEKSFSPTIFNEANLFNNSADNCHFILFYTGLPNAKILQSLFKFLLTSPLINSSNNTKLSSFEEFMVAIIKLRLNPPMQDLAYRFGISCSTVQRIFHKWITIMNQELQPVTSWPEREDLRLTMPDCFKVSFGSKVAVIIDCFEVFIERPSGLLARAATWSSYKHHNTVKFLIGITPQGVVSYISEAWGGRVSDKYITENCGILNNLLPDDIVLADRGFDIADSVGVYHAKLHLPAFTRGKNQLSALEVEATRSIANVRIHVERVIGSVKQKYSILKGTLP
jgi:hypothetical protein